MVAPGPALHDLGGLVRRRREAAGLTVRAAASRIGISPSYLIAIEKSRNPTTGRAPMPSPPVLAALGRVLDIDLDLLLTTTTATTGPAHVLLYQTDTAAGAPLDAARAIFAGEVDAWIDAAPPPGSCIRDAGDALDRLARKLEAAARSDSPRRLGVLFGGSSRALLAADDPGRMVASETTWHADVTARFRAALGCAPVANVCVYREADLRELAPRLDRLATIVRLIRSHEGVVVQDGHGRLVTGPSASEAMLADARPGGVGAETWQMLAAAAAAGLARAVARPR
jgi:transcriptional regulator with XRE-family HTH domain